MFRLLTLSTLTQGSEDTAHLDTFYRINEMLITSRTPYTVDEANVEKFVSRVLSDTQEGLESKYAVFTINLTDKTRHALERTKKNSDMTAKDIILSLRATLCHMKCLDPCNSSDFALSSVTSVDRYAISNTRDLVHLNKIKHVVYLKDVSYLTRSNLNKIYSYTSLKIGISLVYSTQVNRLQRIQDRLVAVDVLNSSMRDVETILNTSYTTPLTAVAEITGTLKVVAYFYPFSNRLMALNNLNPKFPRLKKVDLKGDKAIRRLLLAVPPTLETLVVRKAVFDLPPNMLNGLTYFEFYGDQLSIIGLTLLREPAGNKAYLGLEVNSIAINCIA
jgi:hypothetical protein